VSLADVYRYWGAGDWTPRFDFYAPDMEWGWSDEFPGIDGVYHDTETPNSRLQTWLDEWEYWHCEAEDYVVCGDTVAVLTRYRGRGKGSGVEVDVEGAHVWKLRDGKAVRLEVFADRERALRAASGMASEQLAEDAAGCFAIRTERKRA
jgi:ketosteroid isomerase-like protein